MKTIVKVFAIILGIMFVSGCSNEMNNERYEGIEFEYNGYSYIWFTSYTWKATDIIGTVHNPDCKCKNIK